MANLELTMDNLELTMDNFELTMANLLTKELKGIVYAKSIFGRNSPLP